MKLYISGPMTGLPELNFPAFHAAAAELRALGFEVVNPAELNPDGATPWAQCMRNDIKALCDCDVLALMRGWEQSKGAHLELHLAHRLEIGVVFLKDIIIESFAADVSRTKGAAPMTLDALKRSSLPDEELKIQVEIWFHAEILESSRAGHNSMRINPYFTFLGSRFNDALLAVFWEMGKRPGFKSTKTEGSGRHFVLNKGSFHSYNISWDGE